MTYRSEEGALAAELQQVEAELAEAEERARSLVEELGRRRAARRRRRLRALLLLGCLVAVTTAGARIVTRKREVARLQRDQSALESEITGLEQRVDQLGRVLRIAEVGAPLIGVLSSLGTPHDPALFEAIRAADPAKSEDAWWIVAHAACRLSHAEQEKAQALAALAEERRENARAFCEKGPPKP